MRLASYEVAIAATVVGRFVEVVPHRRLVFTYGWEDGRLGVPPGSTTGEIDLTEEDGTTTLRLVHHGLPPEPVPDHQQGWTYFLGVLRDTVAAADRPGRAPGRPGRRRLPAGPVRAVGYAAAGWCLGFAAVNAWGVDVLIVDFLEELLGRGGPGAATQVRADLDGGSRAARVRGDAHRERPGAGGAVVVVGAEVAVAAAGPGCRRVRVLGRWVVGRLGLGRRRVLLGDARRRRRLLALLGVGGPAQAHGDDGLAIGTCFLRVGGCPACYRGRQCARALTAG